MALLELGLSRKRMTRIAAKVRWGIRSVGLVPAVVGAIRLAALRGRRPRSAVLRLRSGPELEFEYPRQLVPALVVFGDYIDPEYEFLKRVARDDWVVIDVGAAIGQFSVFVAMLPVAAVHAYEPSAENLLTLERNISRNHVTDRITVHGRVLAARVGETTFRTAGNPYLSRPGETGSSTRDEILLASTLDIELTERGLSRFDCLKLNVAGYEGEVLEGARESLAAQRADFLIILISESSLGWFGRLEECGYRFYFFHPQQHRLHRVRGAAEISAADRPWPARHVIGISGRALDEGLVGAITRAGDS